MDDEEFYQLLDKDGITDDIHLFNEKLCEWEDYYNYHRPHGALDGQTPRTDGGENPSRSVTDGLGTYTVCTCNHDFGLEHAISRHVARGL